MKIKLGYGESMQEAYIPNRNILKIITPNINKNIMKESEIIKRALQNPISSPRLGDIVKKGESIAVVTSDTTRPMPTWKVMPLLLDELYEAGVRKEDITLVFALGNHRKHTEKEKRCIVGDRIYEEIRCVDSNAGEFVNLGITKMGTPVDIASSVANADTRICLGNIEYHYFAGYSGGAKALMPGVSTNDAIRANHAMMLDEKAYAGNIIDNPVRNDIEEAGKICGIDFILNVVLDENKNIKYSVAGDAVQAHRVGCRLLDDMCKIKISQLADVVIVSQGGKPKDINLYQAQKALDNAKHAVKKGGTIILVSSCEEGFGQKTFGEWLMQAKCPTDLLVRIKNEFQLGGHKAAAIATILKDIDVFLVSEMRDEMVKKAFMKPYDNLQKAVDMAIDKHGTNAKFIIMPYGGATLPELNVE